MRLFQSPHANLRRPGPIAAILLGIAVAASAAHAGPKVPASVDCKADQLNTPQARKCLDKNAGNGGNPFIVACFKDGEVACCQQDGNTTGYFCDYIRWADPPKNSVPINPNNGATSTPQ